MIIVNGVEIEFDIININDYKQFTKNFEQLKKVLNNKNVDIDSLSNIIINIVGKDQAEKLLEDNRIDTLLMVTLELFEALYDQYETFGNTMETIKDRLAMLNKKINKEE